MKNILVTGGAGYIGSHVVKYLMSQNYNVHVIDNLITGHEEAILTSNKYIIDILNIQKLKSTIKSIGQIDCILHLAAFSQVGESIINPAKYYTNNIIGTLNLLQCMLMCNIQNIVFSSTCAVYGKPSYLPIDEKHPLGPINPYGQSKLTVEQILYDYSKAYDINCVVLRYFNAAGADSSAQLGESHYPETHLIPLIFRAIKGEMDSLPIFGSKYNTTDGTCIRDYIHVEDLAEAHKLAMEYLFMEKRSCMFNLGTGNGYSVLDILKKCEEILNISVPIQYKNRRAGDQVVLFADPTKAQTILGWQPKHNLDSIITSAWNWELNRKF